MGFDEDWNSGHQRDQEEIFREVEGVADLAQSILWAIIIGTLVMFLVVLAITYYCYKKKRVTPGFVIRSPPENGYNPLATGYSTGAPGYPTGAPGYPAGAPVYPTGTPGYPPGAPGYPPGAPGYQTGAPAYPIAAPGYPTEKFSQPPAYSSGNYTQS